MPLRILHVVTYMGRGGLETMLMNYYRHMDRSKVQFDFLVHRDFNADYDDEILSLGGRIYHVSRLVPWSKRYRQELKEFYKAHPEYKIVHVHQDCLSSVALQCAKECGIPIRIAHSHSASAVKNIKYPIKLHYMKKIPKYATQLFACGELAGNWMFGGADFEVVHNAVDTENYICSQEKYQKIREQFGVKNEILIGHVGSFSPAKNHSFIIDIFNEVIDKQTNAKLILVGNGDGRPAIEEKVKSFGLEDKIIFTGIRTDVNEIMQAMDVFLFPSLYEGLPVTLVEAQAAGLPILMSDQISEESVITQDLITIKSLSDSADAWADKLIEIAGQKKENHILEVRESGYDIQNEAKKLQEFYLEKMEDVK